MGETTWLMVVYVLVAIVINLAVIGAAWYLLWELVLKEIKFLRKFFDTEINSRQTTKQS